MKKLISYLLVLVLAFSAVSTVTFAKGEQLLSSDEYMQNVVTGLNLVNTKLSEKEYITRADFALVLMNLINEPITVSGNTSYTDVKGASKETAAIELARAKDLMVGVGDNQFAPDQPILFSQAVKLILKATNNVRIFNNEEIIAEDNFRRLTKGLSFADTSAVDYETLAHLVFNALNVTISKATFDNPGTMSGDVDANEKLPEYFFDYKRVEGVLQADAYSSIISAYGNNTTVTINGVNYKSTNDYNAHLGFYVDAFVNEDNEIVFLTANDENNIIVLDDTMANYADAGRVYTYQNKNGKVEKVAIPDGTPIAYNERAMATYSVAKMLPQDGYVTLIDNNDDGDIDVVRVVEYVNINVQGSSTEENVTQIFDANSGITATLLTEAEGETAIILDAEGNVAEVKNLRAGVVASVIGEISTNVSTDAIESVAARRIIISDATVTGKVQTIDMDEGTITLDGEAYYYDANFDASTLSFGREYIFGVDFLGKLTSAAVADSTDIPWAFAYVIDASVNGDGVCVVKVITPFNKIIKYKCAEKVKIEGESGRISDHDALVTKFANNNEIIGYTVDEERNIDKVLFADTSTAAKGPNQIPDEFGIYKTSESTSGYKWYSHFSTFYGKITVDEDTIIFAVPETVTSETTDEEYKAISKADLIQSDAKFYPVTGYVFSKDSAYEDIVVVKSTVEETISSGAYLSVVKSINQTLNEDDEVSYEVTIIENKSNTAKENTYVASEKVITGGVLQGKKYGTDTKLNVDVGDVITYSVNSLNEIVAIEIMAEGPDNFYDTAGDYVGNEGKIQINTTRRLLPASVYSVDNSYITLVKNGVEPKDATWSDIEEVTLSRCAIIVIEEDAGKKNVKIGAIKDIDSYIEKGKSSRVLINMLGYISYALIIYK